MRAKEGFSLLDVCSENIIVAGGKENIDFSTIISMNESSAYLWREIQGKEFTNEDLAELLCKEYDVDYDRALADAATISEKWIEAGIAER